jgi:nucleotide-binding universal stress UspA family protein
MYQKILVPLDGSTCAAEILPHVAELARCMQSELILLRVYMPDFTLVDSYGHAPEFYEELRHLARAEAIKYLEAVEADLVRLGLTVRVVVVEGQVVASILAVARREAADLIAMSSHGRTGLARVFYGSVAAGVLHQVDRPLLLVRADDQKEPQEPKHD